MQHFAIFLDTRNMLRISKVAEVTIKGVSYVAKGPCNAPEVPIIVDVEEPKTASKLGITVLQQRPLGAIAAIAAPIPSFLLDAAFLTNANAFTAIVSAKRVPIIAETVKE